MKPKSNGYIFEKVKISLFSFYTSFIFRFDMEKYLNSCAKLYFDSNGNFKIVQFTDIHTTPNNDFKTIAHMNRVLDIEKPNLVILTGDMVDTKCTSCEDIKAGITQIANPMENRKIPWAIVFGNHDDEHLQMTKVEMMNFYMSFKYNISSFGFETSNRIGNYNILICPKRSNVPKFNLYLLDSGKYSLIGFYGYITLPRIAWYKKTALALTKKYKKSIPSLMFFHIPLPEFRIAYEQGYINGDRFENECSPIFNSGLFSTAVDTGDVKGIFVGHDHSNNYTASLEGITLGYGGTAGYTAYTSDLNLGGRGARVFLINEKNPKKFKTWLRNELNT